jgi:hypothetical protein
MAANTRTQTPGWGLGLSTGQVRLQPILNVWGSHLHDAGLVREREVVFLAGCSLLASLVLLVGRRFCLPRSGIVLLLCEGLAARQRERRTADRSRM